MKKILILFAFLFSFANQTFSQSTTPRGALGTSNGGSVRVFNYSTYRALTDASGKDTSYLAPGGRLTSNENGVVTNYLHIGSAAGDTLNSSHCLTIKDTTVSNVALASTDNYSFRGDRMIIDFKTNGVGVKDTLFGYGAILFDTTGSGTNKALYIKKDLTQMSFIIELVFDGTNWVQATPRTTGFSVIR